MEKPFLQRFKKEITAGAIGAGALFGALHESEKQPETPQKTFVEKDLEINKVEASDQVFSEVEKKESEDSFFSESEFLLSELFELGADAHETKQLFEEIEGELIDNRFSGSEHVYDRYFEHEVESDDYEKKKAIIYAAAEKAGISGAMLHALCYVETGCQPLKNKSSKAAGYFQFLVPAAKAYGLEIKGKKDERYDLKKSATAAAKYLAKLKEYFGQEGLAMVAYSGGQGKLERRLREAFPHVFSDTERRARIKELHAEILHLKKEMTKKKKREDRLQVLRTINELRKELRPLVVDEKNFMEKLPETLENEEISLVSYMIDGGYDETGSAEYPIAVQLYAKKFEEAEARAKRKVQIVKQ